ncbi:MAG: hypothetical protein LBJ37_23495 [Paucimonas sp.]|jgi:hypothetical protein|nr:hypothetical protein [Paucimonas sp.]
MAFGKLQVCDKTILNCFIDMKLPAPVIYNQSHLSVSECLTPGTVAALEFGWLDSWGG